ncbi:(deoxy)nucleoside triphosphate pyrophosphohydrolase [Gordonia soli]|uniref:8-oxo-dGTP diphosphatase n=1 Tax=Gordonia soli NBRC 108243 TaxID=1223545 RepID=M0QDQ7_9ACTN|nr:NUDIX domain-containing protein [Gordonia soli]GAC66446.1 putative NTP pyrophosphohydrolase [Gordonia soli NBRC 108243]
MSAAGPVRLVVAGAIIDLENRSLLLARRRYPAEVAGLWELPGGKVEVGETPERALRRELAEELGIDVEVGGRIGPEVALRADLVLIALTARVVSGTATPTEHSAVRWVDGAGLSAMASEGELVPADAVWVSDLIEELARRA